MCLRLFYNILINVFKQIYYGTVIFLTAPQYVPKPPEQLPPEAS
jgi:hypothetical protein